jgi:hypothetical protein
LSGFFDETVGTVMMRMRMADVIASGSEGFISSRTADITSILYKQTLAFRSYDGTTVAVQSTGWSASDVITAAVTFGSDGFSIHYRNVTQDGGWVHDTVSPFDGAFSISGGILQYFFDNPHKINLPDHEILGTSLTNAQVEARYG